MNAPDAYAGVSIKHDLPSSILQTMGVERKMDPYRPCILLAEDNVILRYTLSAAIAKVGYQVIEAEDGCDALQRAAEFHGFIHVLLTDIRMPRMDGHELSRRIKQTRPEIKVIVLSAHDKAQFPPDAPLPDCSLVKPVYPHVVVRKIKEMLRLGGVPRGGGT